MAVDGILDAARAGLAFERLRMDAASRNIAGANVALAQGQDAMRYNAGGSAFADLVGAPSGLSRQPAGVREVHDPGHPLADAAGMVRYPRTDMVVEMTTLMTASRGYEANVRSFNLLRGMILRALEIGAK